MESIEKRYQALEHNVLQRNPNARSMIQVIQNGDAKKGEEIARNLCDTYGIKPEDAVQQARSFFRV